jgi:hypothetical protein
MDSDRIHKALMGLDIAISCCTSTQFVCKAHEKQKEEDDSCKKLDVSLGWSTGVGLRDTYIHVGTTVQLTGDWMRSRHLVGGYPGY